MPTMKTHYLTPTTDILTMPTAQLLAGWDSQYQGGIDPTPGGSDDFATHSYSAEWDESDE